MIITGKEPQLSEWVLLREGEILFTYLYLVPDPAQTRGLIEPDRTAIAYETVTEPLTLPLLAPMNEVAGRLSIEAAGFALRKHAGGHGLLGGVLLAASVVAIGVVGGAMRRVWRPTSARR
ncbi:hypothetical protein [Bradyrhizobium niftali]|uniref:Alanine dehydrogenase/pyridine nucleotide transhydrogenase N-terminal domain-containing protein n=1 Tax=Bradyrhizobium niftali TaxID=2560055 RepID=A0A4Y9L193_9BRAD|nr:hypothetical protein [Bradyrhizobium niftali]TFV37348.1 hypothetical protein E4K65_44060 [Bradyrhizobium niftali]